MTAASGPRLVHPSTEVRPGRGRVFDLITDTIGDTPLVRLNRLPQIKGLKATILAKLEFFNPLGSVKDRIGVSMIDALEAAGTLTQDTVLIEPTSGNTGIALAFVAAARGYRLILVMPELDVAGAAPDALAARCRGRADPGRRRHARRDRPRRGARARYRHRRYPAAVQAPGESAIHRRTTAEEIWNDTAGAVDVFVAGVGTGGTITGVGQVLKPRKPSLRIVAVEPEDSAVLSGRRARLAQDSRDRSRLHPGDSRSIGDR